MSRRLLCGLFAAIILVGLSATLAAAAEIKMAVVDIDSISSQYKDLTDKQAELGAWVKEKRDYLAAMQDFMFVSGEEFQEASRIYQVAKAQWSEEQKKRETEVRTVSGNNEKKFLDLQAKPGRSAEEQNQFNTLRDIFQARDRDLKAISAEFDKQLKAKREEVQSKLVQSVRKVIEKVAGEKGYQLVIDKSAVYFVAAPVDDITDEVLKALNAGGAAPATTPNP